MAKLMWYLTLNFDSGIDNVKFNYGSREKIFSTSVEQYPVNHEPGNNVILTVTLKNGYALDKAVYNNGIAIGTINGNIITIPEPESNASYTWTLTSKQATSKVSIDLTTLTGWDNVTPGEHQISVVAKATGYRDSAKSAAVTFTKASVSTGETWVLNDKLHFGAKSWSYNVNFTSNGNSYNTFAFNFSSPLEAYLVYGSTNVYDTNSYWTNDAYRTITFETAPTGALLTWLQANGTKQGGTTAAHTLTIEEQFSYGDNITVNGNSVTSPYTLQNGDVIKVPTTNSTTTINGTSYSIRDESVLNINNQDIVISRTGPEKVISPSPYITINYTENANSGGEIN